MDYIITMMQKKIKSGSKDVILGQETWNYAQGISLKRESSFKKRFNEDPIVIM